jgi:hypothetical protein
LENARVDANGKTEVADLFGVRIELTERR